MILGMHKINRWAENDWHGWWMVVFPTHDPMQYEVLLQYWLVGLFDGNEKGIGQRGSLIPTNLQNLIRTFHSFSANSPPCYSYVSDIKPSQILSPNLPYPIRSVRRTLAGETMKSGKYAACISFLQWLTVLRHSKSESFSSNDILLSSFILLINPDFPQFFLLDGS